MTTQLTSEKLVELINKHPDYPLIAKVDFKAPYRGDIYHREILAGDIDDVFKDNRESYSIVLCMTNGAYDAHKRIGELETIITSVIQDVEGNGMICGYIMAKATTTIYNHLPFEIETPNLELWGNQDNSGFAKYLSKKDLPFDMSIDLSDPQDDDERLHGLRIYTNQPKAISVDNEASRIVVEFEGSDDNYKGFKRLVDLEDTLIKLIDSSKSTRTGSPHMNVLKKAKKLVSARIVTA
ncbi:hypothetical protein [Vibrio crassostreae]|uniref:hypothetical protein n=1 Tax=Vibrio crassostreae TaxID=246167 RepID=UPI001B3079D1|nr:hypothetical protein [Vibrio crassostreae]